MYRPQFAQVPAPLPCEDQPVQYSYDSSNCPSLLGTLAAGAQTGRIPLNLDKDADHFIRAFRTMQPQISIRIEDPNGNPLSDLDNADNQINFERPDEYSFTQGAGFVVLEAGKGGIFAPRGSNFLVYLYNNGTSTVNLTTFCINLFGIKRFTGELCQ